MWNAFLTLLQEQIQQQPHQPVADLLHHHERTRSSPSSLLHDEGRISPRYETPPGTPPPPYHGEKVIETIVYHLTTNICHEAFTTIRVGNYIWKLVLEFIIPNDVSKQRV